VNTEIDANPPPVRRSPPPSARPGGKRPRFLLKRWLFKARWHTGNLLLAAIRKWGPGQRWCDDLYAFILFLRCHGRRPTRTSCTLNDILYHIKTSDEITKPLRVLVSDKEFLKQYVRDRVGERYNVPTVAVLRSREEALAFNYPADCVIKPTNSYEDVIIRRAGAALDFETIQRWFTLNPYRRGRQRNYRSLQPKVIVEELVFGTDNPTDYKVMCYHGQPRVILVVANRRANRTVSCYTTDWTLLPFTINVPLERRVAVPKPANLGEMLRVASVLAQDFNLIRIDLYSDDRSLRVGEITNCHANATCQFVPARGERLFADLLFGRDRMTLAAFEETVS
jgi:hypothetical protein